LFKPALPAVQLHSTPSEPLLASETDTAIRSNESTAPSASFLRKTLSFDLNLARVSLIIDIVCITSAGLATNSAGFVAATTLTCLGMGFGPTIQSVAVELHNSSYPGAQAETGKVFGALGVLQALWFVSYSLYAKYR
jgi:hypothetical protein